MLRNERDVLLDWTKNFIDRDGKIVKEFQTTFHSSFWEFYLNYYFTQNNSVIDHTFNRPDFIIKHPHKIYVEAVVANIKQGGIPETQRTLEDQLSMFIPPWLQTDFSKVLDEAIIRYSNAIHSKQKKYIKEYSKCDWVDTSAPFVIAMASYDQVNYGREYIYPMMALLYGLYYSPEFRGYSIKNSIKKYGTDAEVFLNLFSKLEFNDISAIVFSCTTTIGKLTSLAISAGKPSNNQVFAFRENCSDIGPKYQLQIVSKDNPETLSDGLFVFHNPNALNPLDKESFPYATHFFYDEDEINISGVLTPLISRINTSKIMTPILMNQIQEHLRNYNDMTIDEFYEQT